MCCIGAVLGVALRHYSIASNFSDFMAAEANGLQRVLSEAWQRPLPASSA
jgi:hypothetical protein